MLCRCEIILVWFPSLSIMHLKFTHMAAYNSSSFLLLLSGISLNGPQFVYPFPQLRIFGLFQFGSDPTENFYSHIQVFFLFVLFFNIGYHFTLANSRITGLHCKCVFSLRRNFQTADCFPEWPYTLAFPLALSVHSSCSASLPVG